MNWHSEFVPLTETDCWEGERRMFKECFEDMKFGGSVEEFECLEVLKSQGS